MLIIKNMEMPVDCNHCRFKYDGLCHAVRKSFDCSHAFVGGRLEDCPLVAIDATKCTDDATEMMQLILSMMEKARGQSVGSCVSNTDHFRDATKMIGRL